MRGLLELFRSGGGRSVGFSALALLLTVVTGVLTARALSVDERGIAATVLAVGAMLAQSFNAGPAETQLIAGQRGLGARSTVLITWAISGAIGLVAAVPSAIYAFAVTEPSTVLILMLAVLPILSSVGVMANYLLLADGRIGLSGALRVLPLLVQVAALSVLIAFDVASVETVVLSSVIASVVACGIGIRSAKPWARVGGNVRAEWREVVRLAATTGGSHALRIWGYRVDLVLLGLIGGTFEAGLYAVAISLTAAGTAVTANLAPLMMGRQADRAAAFTQTSMVLSLGLGFAIAVLGPWVIPIVYGTAYAPSPWLILVLATAMVGAFALDATTRLIQAAGFERRALGVSVFTFVLQVSLITILAHLYGAVGAALANVVAYAMGGLALALFGGVDARRIVAALSLSQGFRLIASRLRSR